MLPRLSRQVYRGALSSGLDHRQQKAGSKIKRTVASAHKQAEGKTHQKMHQRVARARGECSNSKAGVAD